MGGEAECKLIMDDLGDINNKITKTLDVTLKPDCILLIGVSHGLFKKWLGGATIITTTNNLLNGNTCFFDYNMVSDIYAANVNFAFQNNNDKLLVMTYGIEYNKNCGNGSVSTNLWITSVSQIPCKFT